MRRLGTWCTTHRRTVILAWLAALLVAGFAAQSAGSAFSENFELPSSDSQRALDLLKDRFPAQSGETATIVFKTAGGVEAAPVEARMSAAFDRIEEVPHVSEVASPYDGPGAAAISGDGKIAYATVQFDAQSDKIGTGNIERVMDIAEAAAGPGLQVELGGQPIEEVRQEEEGGSSFAIGLMAAIVILLLTFGSRRRDGASHRHGAVRARGRVEPRHPGHPRLRHRRLRNRACGDDRAWSRNRLRPLHPDAFPQRPRRRT